jgi:hypothetical protein
MSQAIAKDARQPARQGDESNSKKGSVSKTLHGGGSQEEFQVRLFLAEKIRQVQESIFPRFFLKALLCAVQGAV